MCTQKSGVILIDKPRGPTSHDVVQTVKNILNAEKAGHSGTLDPNATGLLLIVINEATKAMPVFVGLDKEDNVKDLDSMWEKYFNTDRDSELDSWLVIQSKPENGKLVYRKEMCLWNEALTDLPDIELKYLVCCYGDFQGVKRENKHFVLTMEHTVVEGDPYCSCIVHDTRIDWKLTHPSREYWDKIWPLHEWQK